MRKDEPCILCVARIRRGESKGSRSVARRSTPALYAYVVAIEDDKFKTVLLAVHSVIFQ